MPWEWVGHSEWVQLGRQWVGRKCKPGSAGMAWRSVDSVLGSVVSYTEAVAEVVDAIAVPVAAAEIFAVVA